MIPTNWKTIIEKEESRVRKIERRQIATEVLPSLIVMHPGWDRGLQVKTAVEYADLLLAELEAPDAE
jgi:hypothetical protein